MNRICRTCGKLLYITYTKYKGKGVLNFSSTYQWQQCVKHESKM
jgi:hypothetical protein